MVPPPSRWHQELGASLMEVVRPLARQRGLSCLYEVGLYRGDRDYRVPDLVIFRPEHGSDRGVDAHAEVVVELLSPQDESREKLPFYESISANEVFLIEPVSRVVELYLLRGGRLLPVLPESTGAFRSAVLGLELRPVAGPRLRLTWEGGSQDI
jgi:Uma2 family endonuclease